VNSEEISAEQPKLHWFIDLDWFPQHNRSFPVLAWGCLCSACRGRLEGKPGEIAAADLLATIRDCCSKAPGFISGELPILESIFHLFLANGNQPLDLEQLSQQLNKWRSGDSYRTSPEILSRLLEHDQYYGLRQIQDSLQELPS
jgi:hypothetical protein